MSAEKDLIHADLESLSDRLLAALDDIALIRAAVDELPEQDLDLFQQIRKEEADSGYSERNVFQDRGFR